MDEECISNVVEYSRIVSDHKNSKLSMYVLNEGKNSLMREWNEWKRLTGSPH